MIHAQNNTAIAIAVGRFVSMSSCVDGEAPETAPAQGGTEGALLRLKEISSCPEWAREMTCRQPRAFRTGCGKVAFKRSLFQNSEWASPVGRAVVIPLIARWLSRLSFGIRASGFARHAAW